MRWRTLWLDLPLRRVSGPILFRLLMMRWRRIWRCLSFIDGVELWVVLIGYKGWFSGTALFGCVFGGPLADGFYWLTTVFSHIAGSLGCGLWWVSVLVFGARSRPCCSICPELVMPARMGALWLADALWSCWFLRGELIGYKGWFSGTASFGCVFGGPLADGFYWPTTVFLHISGPLGCGLWWVSVLVFGATFLLVAGVLWFCSVWFSFVYSCNRRVLFFLTQCFSQGGFRWEGFNEARPLD